MGCGASSRMVAAGQDTDGPAAGAGAHAVAPREQDSAEPGTGSETPVESRVGGPEVVPTAFDGGTEAPGAARGELDARGGGRDGGARPTSPSTALGGGESVSALHNKFLQDPEFAGGQGVFGGISMFDSGLEGRVGRMDVLPTRALYGEHCLSLDSDREFQASNASGTTTPRKEWQFVVGKDAVDETGWEFRPVLREAGGGCSMQRGRNAKTIEELMGTEEAKASSLRTVELVALRLYTGPMYYKYNACLRGQIAPGENGGNVYSTTINLIVSGLLKISRVTRPPVDRRVYRGMSGVALPPSFFELDEQGFAGGTEMGFMSTTSVVEVATEYARWGTKALPTLFRLELGKTSVGADVTWLSQFEHEREMLYPPLTHLEIVGKPVVEAGLSIVTLRPTVNQHFQVLEDVVGHRRNGLKDVANSLAWDMRHWAVREGVLGEWEHQVEGLQQKMEEEVASNKAEWYNANSRYRQAFNSLMDVWEAGCVDLAESLWGKANSEFGEGGGDGELQSLQLGRAIRARADLCVPTEANSKRLVAMRREMVEKLRGREGVNEGHVIVAKQQLSTALKEAAQVQEAASLLGECVAYFRRRGDAVQESMVLNDMALCQQDLGEYHQSVESLEASIALLRGMEEPPLGTIAQKDTNVANALFQMGKNEEALKRHQSALAVKKSVKASNVDIAASEIGIALALQALQLPEEALAYFRRAYEVQKDTLGLEHIDVAYTLHNLAMCLRKAGNNEEALAAYQRVIKIKVKRLGESHPDVAVTRMNVGVLHYSMGRFAEALQLYEQAGQSFRGAEGKDLELAQIADNMALCYRNLGQMEESVSRSLTAKRLFIASVGRSHPTVATCLRILGGTYEALEKVDDAVREYREELDVLRELSGGKEGTDAADVRMRIVRALWKAKKFDQILEDALECLRVREQAFGADHVETADSSLWVAHGYFIGRGECEKAAVQYQRCLSFFEAKHDDSLRHQEVNIRMSFGICLEAKGQLAEAREQFVASKQMFSKLYGSDSPQCVDAASRAAALAESYQGERKIDEDAGE